MFTAVKSRLREKETWGSLCGLFSQDLPVPHSLLHRLVGESTHHHHHLPIPLCESLSLSLIILPCLVAIYTNQAVVLVVQEVAKEIDFGGITNDFAVKTKLYRELVYLKNVCSHSGPSKKDSNLSEVIP